MGTTNTTHSSEQYAYQDQTKEEGEGITAKSVSAIDEASQAELNPAYYPKKNKPEALHNEAEKAGADFPTRDPAAAASGKDSDGEDLEEGIQEGLMGGAPGAVEAGQGAGQEPGDEQHPPGSQAAEGGNVAPGATESSEDSDTDDSEGEDSEELNDEEVENVLSGTVGEVEAYAEEYPETVNQLLKAEKKGRNRTTLVKALEDMKQG